MRFESLRAAREGSPPELPPGLAAASRRQIEPRSGRRALRTELSREPSDGEIAGAMGLAMDVYQQTFGTGPLDLGGATWSESGRTVRP